jgi:hypothetical protein
LTYFFLKKYNRMNGLRIAPQGQGQYKNAVLNETFQEEEVWPVNVNRLVKTTPVGDNNAFEKDQNLSWANKPKNKMDGGVRSKRNKKRTVKRSHKKNTTRKNRCSYRSKK